MMIYVLRVFVLLWPFVLIYMAYQVAMGILVARAEIAWGTAYWAHISAFLAGMLLILLLKLKEFEEVKPREEIPAIR